MKSKGTIGIDFGTTNSSIACAELSGEVHLAKFPYLGAGQMPIDRCSIFSG